MHVGGRVAQHVEAVGLGDQHRLDDRAGRDERGEVAEFAVDPGDDHVAPVSEQVSARRALVQFALDSVDGRGETGHVVLLPVDCASPRGTARCYPGTALRDTDAAPSVRDDAAHTALCV